jgi:hypothetical protein
MLFAHRAETNPAAVKLMLVAYGGARGVVGQDDVGAVGETSTSISLMKRVSPFG